MSERTPRAPLAGEYPRDEFDDVSPGEGRRGAHRARPNPVLAMLPLLLVVVLVVAVVVGAITLLGEDAPQPVAPAATAPAATEQPADAVTAPASPPATAAVPSAPESLPPVDTEVAVTVLNGTRTSGLATGATRRLSGQGWTVVRADNYREGAPPPTTVFYPREDLAPTAEAVAEDLGGAATDLNEAFGDQGLTVVLGEDYQP